MTTTQVAAKLLTVGRGGVTAYLGGEHRTTISGYIGHDWTDDVGEQTVCVDSRTVPDDVIFGLAVSGPIVDVRQPAGTVDEVFGGLKPWDETAGRFGNAKSLDSVSLDVWVRLYQRAGATVYRGADAVAFAASVSGPRRM